MDEPVEPCNADGHPRDIASGRGKRNRSPPEPNEAVLGCRERDSGYFELFPVDHTSGRSVFSFSCIFSRLR